jgi:hypothetical protein
MKTLKFPKQDSKIDRNLITKFGEKIYSFDEVDAISIKVSFKDGSAISYQRAEVDDKIERIIEKDEKEEED